MKLDPVSDNHGRLSRGLRMVPMPPNLDFWHFGTSTRKGGGIHCPNLPYPRPWIQMGLDDGHCHASSRYSTPLVFGLYFTNDHFRTARISLLDGDVLLWRPKPGCRWRRRRWRWKTGKDQFQQMLQLALFLQSITVSIHLGSMVSRIRISN